jgi:hypothetical protein
VRRSSVDRIAVVVYALVDWLVIMAPSLAIKLAADRGGMGDLAGVDLLVVSAVIATPHAIIAGRRLRYEEHTAVYRADIWIASIDALVVLALATTLLLLVALGGFADEHSSLANRGYPVAALWGGIQLVAVAMAEITARVVFWWLEPHRSRRTREHGQRESRERRQQASRDEAGRQGTAPQEASA